MTTIELIIEKDGRTTITGHGFKGLACLEAMKPIEEAIGSSMEERKLTPEAFAVPQERHQKIQR